MKYALACIVLMLYGSIYGQTLVIHFEFDRYDLSPAAKTSLDSFLLAEHPKIPASVKVEGHCDFVGTDTYNDKLSRKRAEEVKKYLKENGDARLRNLTITGYGERKPLNENKTAGERSLNRRAEITVIQNASSSAVATKGQAAVKNKDVSLKSQVADTAVKTGSLITLRNINFEGGRHEFLPEAYPVLQELVETMNTYPALTIEIRGNICCLAGDVDGLDADTRTYTLSEERARAVYSYLVSHGIKSDRLAYKGYGHSFPIYPYPEQTEEERIVNRRVEIKIVSK